MIIRVRDKEFNIELVSNYVHKLYSEITQESYTISDLTRELQEIGLEYRDNVKGVKDKKRLKEINIEFNDQVVEYNAKIKDATKTIVSKRELTVKALTESNGYEYDPEWWDKKTSPDDINEFMVGCLSDDKKDNNNYGKKK